MSDPITALVHKLLAAEEPNELRKLREQLNQAIHERLEELRKGIRALPPAGPRNADASEDDQVRQYSFYILHARNSTESARFGRVVGFATVCPISMQDRIASLCARLLRSEEPEEVRPIADDLRSAIHEHIDKVRETACEILLVDRVVNRALRGRREISKRRPRPEYQESNQEGEP